MASRHLLKGSEDPMSDVPEADAQEQSESVVPAPETAADVNVIPDDVPEADAIEQAEEVPHVEDDRDQ
jgi:hypothetical protein